jgi:predicted ATPase
MLLPDLLARAPRMKVLVTSLERLNLRGEWTLAIRGLSLPSTEDPEDILASDAGQLFIQGARRVAADCTPSSADLPFVGRICRLVDGIPLGIELASAWTRVITCQEIAHEIEQSHRFLAEAAPDRPERHRSLVAAVDQSWQRLSDAERAALRRLCVFRGGFTREAAEQVAGASLTLLAALIDKNLVQSTPFGRYQISHVVGSYGTEKLAVDRVEHEATSDRHSQYYTAFLKRTTGRFLGTWADDALPEIAAERENLRGAWEWASTHIGQE